MIIYLLLYSTYYTNMDVIIVQTTKGLFSYYTNTIISNLN